MKLQLKVKESKDVIEWTILNAIRFEGQMWEVKFKI